MSLTKYITDERPSPKSLERYRKRRRKLWNIPDWQSKLSNRLAHAEEVKKEVSRLLKPFTGP